MSSYTTARAGAGRGGRPASKPNAFSRDWQLYSLLLIPVAYYLIFKYGPMLGNLIAFRKYVPGGNWLGEEWSGFKYFELFISDPNFWQIFKNTLVISLTSLVFSFPVPILFSLLLNEIRHKNFKRAIQTISYLPHFLSVVVVAGLILDFVSPSGGLLNQAIFALTGRTVSFMQDSKYFTGIYVISGIWQETGWNTIFYLAALTAISPELYEAAEIDGAGRWKQTLHVTMPGIMPTVITLFILSVGSLLAVGFEKILLLYNPAIYERADVLSTYLYRMGLQTNNFSYATAIGLFDSVIGLILVFTANFTSKRLTGSGLW